MNSEFAFDPDSFKGLEYAGWQKGAASYDDLLGSVTRFATVPLLDATDVRAGSQLLEVCCGLGYGAGPALSRGVSVIGIDFAPAMVDAARKRYPKAVFKEVPLAFRPSAPEQVLDLTYSAVRLEMILSSQTAEARERIHRAIIEGAERFRVGGKIEIPMPAVLASATRAW